MQSGLNNYIIVSFDKKHNKVFEVGGVELIRPDEWTLTEEGSTNFNMKEVHPQIATVLVGNPRYPYRKGDKVFLHYMAKETEQAIDVEGEEQSGVDANFVFFVIDGDNMVMAKNTYLGEQVYVDAPKTPSGIYTTPFDKKKEVLKIKLTHVPYDSEYFDVGEVVFTVDDNQYTFEYKGKEYIRLRSEEIVGKYKEDEAA